MKILGVIPSRMESKRLPGKPLLDINGKSMIQRVYESSINCKNLDDLIIATPVSYTHLTLPTICSV